jgi:hypothetical protein
MVTQHEHEHVMTAQASPCLSSLPFMFHTQLPFIPHLQRDAWTPNAYFISTYFSIITLTVRSRLAVLVI